MNTKYLERRESDHRPILTRLVAGNQMRRGTFYFDKRWAGKSEAVEIIRRGWNPTNTNDDMSVSDRITAVRKELSKWKRASIPNSKVMIQNTRTELENESSKACPDFHKMPDLKLKLEEAHREEEKFRKQRSNEKW